MSIIYRNPILMFPCRRGHTLCLECFHLYCAIKLNDRAFIQSEQSGYTLPCPGMFKDLKLGLRNEVKTDKNQTALSPARFV